MTNEDILFITEQVTDQVADTVEDEIAAAGHAGINTWRLQPDADWQVNAEKHFPKDDTVPIVAELLPDSIPENAPIDTTEINTDRHPDVSVQIGSVTVELQSVIKSAPFGDEFVGRELTNHTVTIYDTADWEYYRE